MWTYCELALSVTHLVAPLLACDSHALRVNGSHPAVLTSSYFVSTQRAVMTYLGCLLPYWHTLIITAPISSIKIKLTINLPADWKFLCQLPDPTMLTYCGIMDKHRKLQPLLIPTHFLPYFQWSKWDTLTWSLNYMYTFSRILVSTYATFIWMGSTVVISSTTSSVTHCWITVNANSKYTITWAILVLQQ